MSQQQRSVKADAVPRQQLFNCVHADCGATFTRKWRLEEHVTAHTGARPHKCPVEGCARQFSRRSHRSRHVLSHKGKSIRCSAVDCSQTFTCRDKLKRHVRYVHEDKDSYFKCLSPGCVMTFKKRRLLKLHLATHGVSDFRCSQVGCSAKFNTHIARKAHEKTHQGYHCPHPQCAVVEYTWGKLLKHTAKHPASHSCSTCKKTFVKCDALRRHKRTHALQRPVLLCPSEGCKAYFSTTFNLQHHIRKVHLKLLRHCCAFPDCNRAFAMRESLIRHMLHHDPNAAKPKRRQRRSSKSWQKRLEGRGRGSMVEDDLRRLFALRMRFPRRTKLEANLSGLFNERKIPHRVDPEVNLRDLFNIKPSQKVKG